MVAQRTKSRWFPRRIILKCRPSGSSIHSSTWHKCLIQQGAEYSLLPCMYAGRPCDGYAVLSLQPMIGAHGVLAAFKQRHNRQAGQLLRTRARHRRERPVVIWYPSVGRQSPVPGKIAGCAAAARTRRRGSNVDGLRSGHGGLGAMKVRHTRTGFRAR